MKNILIKMFYIIQTIVKVIVYAKNIQKTIKFLSKDIFIYNEKLPIDDGKNLIWTKSNLDRNCVGTRCHIPTQLSRAHAMYSQFQKNKSKSIIDVDVRNRIKKK